MKEHPILFSGDMVRAILAGRKTQTRRVMKFAYHKVGKYGEWAGAVLPARESGWVAWWPGNGNEELAEFTKQQYREGLPCPYGVPGDRLWVRETWMPETEDGTPNGSTIYRATNHAEPDGDRPLRWRPSIYMPRGASRITLEVTDVRVQRVQELSEEDAEAEGITSDAELAPDSPRLYGYGGEFGWRSSVRAFEHLWDSINAKRGYPWQSNPWVWAITFERLVP